MCIVWREIFEDAEEASRLNKSAQTKHLLRAILFMKEYAKERVHASMCKCDEKTFRKWSWRFVEAISYLDEKYVYY